jgi:hypothetical protein
MSFSTIRRVVTGHDANGRAIVMSDGPLSTVAEIAAIPGTVFHEVWSTSESPAVVNNGSDPTIGELMLPPPRYGTRVRFVDIPPDTPEFLAHGAAAHAAFSQIGDADASTVQADSPHPLMHRTESIDYGVVIEGEMTLILDGAEVVLKQGNVVIQRGPTMRGRIARTHVPDAVRVDRRRLPGDCRRAREPDGEGGTMKFSSLPDGADGRLLLVSRDLRYAVDAAPIAPTLLDALQRWDAVAPLLAARYDALNAGALPDARPFDPQACAAPLPRSPQWCDGSAFLNHGRLMEQAFNTPPIPEFDTVPVMYQGASDDFLGPHHDVPLPDEHDGIDFEGEFGVVVANVPMGVSPDDAVRRVRLIVQLNDWSLRAFGPREMKTGFGFLQAKPPRALRPSRSRRTNWASIGATVACICVCTWTGMSAGSGIRMAK